MINAAGRVGLERLPCACHILHNSVKAALEKQEPLNSIVVKLHNLASFFHRSPKMTQALELEQMPDEHENLATLNRFYPRDNEWRAASLIIDALSVFDDVTLLFSSSEYGLATSMFAWMTVVLFAMEENTSGIEEVDTLRRNLQLEIGNRVKESEILIKASFFHPTYNLLYKQCNENFGMLKDILRREMQNIKPPANAPIKQQEIILF
ncbi:MAG: hypothetical protein JOS17DRAFT_772185 [Linnemannia elongata]|nr:MAG: hypothetical protein JOS17DRAFT_772185 [Linnemannia elongata]